MITRITMQKEKVKSVAVMSGNLAKSAWVFNYIKSLETIQIYLRFCNEVLGAGMVRW